MKLDQIIDSLILEIYPLMPSTGTWPFTMVRVERNNLRGMEQLPQFYASSGLLILQRTDFLEEHLVDYAWGAKEYGNPSSEQRLEYLEKHRKQHESKEKLKEWVDRITSLAIGLISQVAIQKGLHLNPIGVDFSVVDTYLKLKSKNLKTYQLFDIYQIDPSSFG